MMLFKHTILPVDELETQNFILSAAVLQETSSISD